MFSMNHTVFKKLSNLLDCRIRTWKCWNDLTTLLNLSTYELRYFAVFRTFTRIKLLMNNGFRDKVTLPQSQKYYVDLIIIVQFTEPSQVQSQYRHRTSPHNTPTPCLPPFWRRRHGHSPTTSPHPFMKSPDPVIRVRIGGQERYFWQVMKSAVSQIPVHSGESNVRRIISLAVAELNQTNKNIRGFR